MSKQTPIRAYALDLFLLGIADSRVELLAKAVRTAIGLLISAQGNFEMRFVYQLDCPSFQGLYVSCTQNMPDGDIIEVELTANYELVLKAIFEAFHLNHAFE